MAWFTPDYFLHAANVLLLIAYSVRDILWLRLFAVAAALISIPYFMLQPATLWTPLIWSAVFAMINLLQSWRLMLERRPVKLTPEEEEVRQLIFPGIYPRKVLQVIGIGTWTTFSDAQALLSAGTLPEAVQLIVRGKVKISRNGSAIGELGAGELVGSALILSGIPSNVDALSDGPVRCLSWNTETLQTYLAANPDIRAAMQRHLARDLSGKLTKAVQA